jgi:hypothetical protein
MAAYPQHLDLSMNADHDFMSIFPLNPLGRCLL